MAIMLGRQHLQIETGDELLTSLMGNARLSEQFMALARELDVMEPKTPDDIYKTHLETTRPFIGSADGSLQHIASMFVNGFVNAGFGKDKIMLEEGQGWMSKCKEYGLLSAIASLGTIFLWDVDSGLSQIDKYLYMSDEYTRGGALLACGIVCTGTVSEVDPCKSLLSEFLAEKPQPMIMGACFGYVERWREHRARRREIGRAGRRAERPTPARRDRLGIAYAGTRRQDVGDLLLPLLSDAANSMEVVSMAALSLGLIFTGAWYGGCFMRGLRGCDALSVRRRAQ